jgi:hypothetical protein
MAWDDPAPSRAHGVISSRGGLADSSLQQVALVRPDFSAFQQAALARDRFRARRSSNDQCLQVAWRNAPSALQWRETVRARIELCTGFPSLSRIG